MTTPTKRRKGELESFDELSNRIRDLLTDRAAGGTVTGSLDEDDPLTFTYADMLVTAHLRHHYDGFRVREGGTILLVMNALITQAPRDLRTLTCILDNSSRYPYTSISLGQSRRDSKSAGWINVYSSLVAETVTEQQLDLSLRSMVQHYHRLPLELGAPSVDVGRRR